MTPFEGKSEEEIGHYFYHKLWGLRHSASVPDHNNITHGLNSEKAPEDCLLQQQAIAKRNVLIRFVYRLFNINNYALNRYRLAAFYAIQQFNVSTQKGNTMIPTTAGKEKTHESTKPSLVHSLFATLSARLPRSWRTAGAGVSMPPSAVSAAADSSSGASIIPYTAPTTEVHTEESIGEQTFPITVDMQPHLKILGIHKDTSTILTWSEIKKAYHKMARFIRTDKGGANDCGLISLSFDPLPIDEILLAATKAPLAALTENKPCYLLYRSKIYFVDNNLIPIALNATGHDEALFPAEKDKKESATKAQLNAIASLTGHVAEIANAINSLKESVFSNKDIPAEYSAEWDAYFREEVVKLREGVAELARGVARVNETLNRTEQRCDNVNGIAARVEGITTRVTATCAKTQDLIAQTRREMEEFQAMMAETAEQSDDNDIDASEARTVQIATAAMAAPSTVSVALSPSSDVPNSIVTSSLSSAAAVESDASALDTREIIASTPKTTLAGQESASPLSQHSIFTGDAAPNASAAPATVTAVEEGLVDDTEARVVLK